MSHRLASCALVALAWGIGGTSAAAQQTTARSEPRARILVLGTYHFANPGLDVVKAEVADVLTPAKQAEIGRVVEALARFRPTKIAVEVRADRAAQLDSAYMAYRTAPGTLDRSEVQQLGFRLAARFRHPRLYAIDHGGEFPFDAVMQYAQEHDTGFVTRVGRVTTELAAEMTRLQRQRSVGEILRLENTPARIREGHALYVETAKVGAGSTYVGANLLAKWYERNIRIFSDLQGIARPGDRIVVIFGAGHAAILRQLIDSDARLELVEANHYLPGR